MALYFGYGVTSKVKSEVKCKIRKLVCVIHIVRKT